MLISFENPKQFVIILGHYFLFKRSLIRLINKLNLQLFYSLLYNHHLVIEREFVLNLKAETISPDIIFTLFGIIAYFFVKRDPNMS